MGTVTAKTIIDRATILLQDVTNVRWPRAELLDWVNEAQQYIVAVKPGANAKVVNQTLALGSYQTLPADGASLIDIPRNVNGRAVRVITREILDAQLPSWHSDTPSSVVTHYVYDPNVPTAYYVYPPAGGSAAVQLTYAATPTAITSELTAVGLSDFYTPALVNYVVFRAYSKDTDYTSNANAAAVYYQMFKDALAGKQAFEMATNPNAALSASYNPNVAASTK